MGIRATTKILLIPLCIILFSFGFFLCASADDTNLAPINDGQWHSDLTWATLPSGSFQYETNPSFQHNGALTWKLGSGSNGAIDHDWGSLRVHVGDHVVISCWVKSDGSPQWYSGTWFGFDFYTGNYNGDWARINGINNPEVLANRGDWQDYGWGDNSIWIVPWGSDWTFKSYDFIVQSTYWTDGGWSPSGVHNPPQGLWLEAQYICPWIGSIEGGSYASQPCNVWVSDFQFKVNPSGSATPTPTPAPTSTPTPNPSATPTPTPVPTPEPSINPHPDPSTYPILNFLYPFPTSIPVVQDTSINPGLLLLGLGGCGFVLWQLWKEKK